MKQKILIAFCIFGFGTAYGQSFAPDVIASSGGFDHVSGSSFSWTIGETVIETVQNTATIFTQGFQQPVPDFFTGVKEIEKEQGFKIYPNPALDVVNIILTDNIGKSFNIEIYDIQGRQLLTNNIANGIGDYQINIASFANGPLFLRISDQKNKVLYKCIIIKN
jgi:hypothetical protein